MGPNASRPGIVGGQERLGFVAIDSHPGAGYALINGSDLPPGHEHAGCSRLDAYSCFGCKRVVLRVFTCEISVRLCFAGQPRACPKLVEGRPSLRWSFLYMVPQRD
jgi:hypothetical protein